MGLVDTGGRTGRHAGDAVCTVLKENLSLNGRVAAGIQNFTAKYVHDASHYVLTPVNIVCGLKGSESVRQCA